MFKNDKLLQTLSKYDKIMIKKYQNQIKDGILIIDSNQDLKSLDFIGFKCINNLNLRACMNIIPKLESQTIKQLVIRDCNIVSMQDFQLKNLEVLTLSNYSSQKSKLLMQEIVKYSKLRVLHLEGCIYIDIGLLSNIISLTKLSLHFCELFNMKAFKQLINLEELYFNYNQGVEITSLQYLTKLTKLSLASCNLICLDALRSLKSLQELDITQNSIVYIQPLAETTCLSQLHSRSNKLLDIETIQKHPNFKNFILNEQKQPTNEQLKTANILKSINSPIISLKLMNIKISKFTSYNFNFRIKITKTLDNQNENHLLFIARYAALLQQMDMDEGCQ
ncbi:Conserved_hypothetical protein [Hexamita inflata]|uniref:Uncharacterized protein n=1 Tax=Hexamita inflata TaxID=28002 RepID=A0ABP1HIY8_9EUKA